MDTILNQRENNHKTNKDLLHITQTIFNILHRFAQLFLYLEKKCL